MADALPIKVVCVMTESTATQLRRGFQQPVGVAPKRAISHKVKLRVATYTPRCVQRGMLSKDAAAYLLGWADGSLPNKSRPTEYTYLKFRQRPENAGDGLAALPWVSPARQKRILLSSQHGEDSDSESDNDAELLAIEDS
jgi:hypothetical protein